MIALATVMAAIIFAVAPQLVSIALGSDYGSSAQALRLLAVSVVPGSVALILAAFLQARGDEQFVAKTAILLGLLGLVTTAIVAVHTPNVAAPVGAFVAASASSLAFARRARWMSKQSPDFPVPNPGPNRIR